MSELRRWSEEGAGEAASLLEASRRERAPTRARARTLEALGIVVAGSAAATGTAVAATNAATNGGLTLLMKVAVLSLVGGGIVAGGVAVVHSAHRRAARPNPVAVDSAAVEPRSVEPPAEVTPVIDAPSPPPNAAGPGAQGHVGRPERLTTRASASAEVLARELRALELVQQALLGRDPDAALRLLDRYHAQFPHGSLSSEATVLRVQALLASGDRAGAQALVDGYCSAHPDSPYARRLNELVHGK
jgi:hypothetical protein